MSTSHTRRRAAGGPRRRPAGAPRPAPDRAPDLAFASAPQGPAPAVSTFTELGLPGVLTQALAGGGIQVPSEIQARSMPDALAGRDVLGRAQTGSGKTLAFGLPILARLAGGAQRRAVKAPHALVVVPTRELAGQVTAVLAPLAATVGLRVAAVYGGVSLDRQARDLRRGVDIVVATPGRLLDLLDRGHCTLQAVEVTVLDEADHMADLGFLPAVTRILDATPAGGQRMLFSATLDGQVDRLVRRYLTEPAVHVAAPAAAPVQAAEHRVYVLPAADKIAVAVQVAGRPGRTLIFVRTKHGADRLAKRLTAAGVTAAAIHGNLNQNQRQRALAGFTAGQPRVLVATDVAARGIHVDDVDLVVHFDPPSDHKGYLHRSGRTARAGASGTVLAFAEPGQVTELARMHKAAGVNPTTETLRPGDDRLAGPAGGHAVPPSRQQRPADRARPAREHRSRRPTAAGDSVPAAPSRTAGAGGSRPGRSRHRPGAAAHG